MGLSGILLLVLVQLSSPASDTLSRGMEVNSSKVLPTPAFTFIDRAQCDKKGNFFFVTSDDGTEVAILKLSADGDAYSTVTDRLNEPFRFVGFRVSASGEVWTLLQTEKAVYLSAKRTNEETSGRVKLDVPEFFAPQEFAVFPSGAALVSGFYDGRADEATRGKLYSAIFSSDGRLQKRLDDRRSPIDTSKLAEKPWLGDAVVASDGRAYRLVGNVLEVITESGEIKKLKLPIPEEPDFLPESVNVSDSLAAISYVRSMPRKPLEVRFLLLNPASNVISGWYKPSADLGNNLVCFSADIGFTFYRVERGRVRLVTAGIK